MGGTYSAACIMCVDGLWMAKAMDLLHVGTQLVDMYTKPGSIRCLVQKTPAAVELISDLVRVSISLHGVRKVILMSHWNCGAYGGSRAFGSPEEQLDTYRRDLMVARETIETLWRHHANAQLVSATGMAQQNLVRASTFGLHFTGVVLRPKHPTHDFVHPEDCVPSIVF